MNEVIAALKAALVAAGVPAYFVDAGQSPAVPYVVLWSSSGTPPQERVVGCVDGFDDNLGVTAVAGTTEGVLMYQDTIRGVLDGFSGSTVGGLAVWLTRYDSRPVQLDRDHPIAANTYPAFGVDMYRLHATPA